MTFTLHAATIKDVEDITRIFQEAFADDDIMGKFHPNTPRHLVWQQDLKIFSDYINEGDIYGGRLTKVVDNDTGKTVAFSKWDYPYTLTPEQAQAKKEKDDKFLAPPTLEGDNGPLLEEFRRQLDAGRKKWIMPEKTFFLNILAVDPAYQRRGLGTMLIHPGLEDADKAGAQTYIEASPAGLPLYLKHGWEPVDAMVIDMRQFGGTAVQEHKSLMREANAPSKLGKKID